MHPELLHIGTVTVFSWGVFVGLGILLSYLGIPLWRQNTQLSVQQLRSTWLRSCFIILIGAKLLSIIVNVFVNNANLNWQDLQRGWVLYGGLLAFIPYCIAQSRRLKCAAFELLDIYSSAGCILIVSMRIGCFLNGCCHGKPSNAWYAVAFVPTQLIEAASVLAIYLALQWRARSQTFKGELFALFLLLYATTRFINEFWRGDSERGFLFFQLISVSQFISLGCLTAALWMLYSKKGEKLLQPQGSPKRLKRHM